MPSNRSHGVAFAVATLVVVAAVGLALGTGLLGEEPFEAQTPIGPGSDGDDGNDTVTTKDPAPSGPFDVTLTVRADQGPLTDEPLPMNDRVFGTNIWFDSGWYPEVDPEWQALLDGMEPSHLRWPSGHPSQNYCFDPTDQGVAPPGCHASHVVTGEQLKAFVALCESVGAEPLIGVNVKRGTPAMAVEMVEYAEVHDLGITWWYLNNEPDIGGNTDLLPMYAEKHAEFTEAMRAADPSVKVVGPEIMTGAHVLGIHGRQDWLGPMLEANEGNVDAISWHLYPLDSENRDSGSSAYASAENLLQWNSTDWRPAGLEFAHEATAKVRADRDAYAPGAEIWVTEIGPDSGMVGAPGVTDAHVSAVWFADVYGRLAAEDTDAILQFAFDHWEEDVDELSLIRQGPEGEGWEALPPYYTHWLYAHTWGDRMVNATSSNVADVGVHATTHEDGTLTVVMVNKATQNQTARLTLGGFGAVARADAYVLTGSGPNSFDSTINGQTLDPANLGKNAIQPESLPPTTDGAYELPALSVTVIEFVPE